MENDEYHADISIDGFQTIVRIEGEVEGTKDQVDISFLKYLPNNLYESYSESDKLISLKIEDKVIYTKWEKLQPYINQVEDNWVVAFEK